MSFVGGPLAVGGGSATTYDPSNRGGILPRALALTEELGPSLTHDRPSEPITIGIAGFTDAERDSLYAELQPLVRRLTRQYGDSYEMRQDLEGEIYFRYCQLLAAYDPERGIPLRAYLVRKLISSVYTFARSQWRRRNHEVSLDGDSELAEQPDPNACGSTWDQELQKQELRKALPAAIAGLPQRQRQVVIWRYYESRSFEEIGEMLGVVPATVRSLLRHGLNNLRRQVNLTHLALE